jgi:Skp family chaperone for outer membrane proteins
VSCGLHDVLSFEGAGLPAVLVASSVFEQAAADQAAKLGAPDVRRVFVAHPVQDRTDDEMRAMAAAVADDLLAALSHS